MTFLSSRLVFYVLAKRWRFICYLIPCNFSEFSRWLNVRTYNNFPLTKIVKNLVMGIWDFVELVNDGVLFIHQKIDHWCYHILWLKLNKLRYSKANLRNLHRKNFMHVLHRMLYITLLFMIHRPNEDPNSKIVISMRTLQTQDPKHIPYFLI